MEVDGGRLAAGGIEMRERYFGQRNNNKPRNEGPKTDKRRRILQWSLEKPFPFY